MPEKHTIADCPQTPILMQIKETLGFLRESQARLDHHGERTALAMEKLAANSATIEGHAQKIKEHDTAFVELFNWRRTFIDKQDDDFRSNLERIVALEKARAVHDAIEVVTEKVEEKEEKKEAVKEQFWNEVRLRLLTPLMVGAFFLIWIIDKTGIAVKAVEMWKAFSK